MKERVKQLFQAIDRKDADSFVSFLTPDASFRFANAPVVRNKEDILHAVGSFLASIKSLRHLIKDIWEQGDVIICEGEVRYTRLNGSELTLPFVDILRIKGDLVDDYRVYIDISPLSS